MKCTVFSAMLQGPRAKQEDCIMDGDGLFQSDRLTKKKEINTDCLLLSVCDGMGGHEHGETASRFVCEQLKNKVNNTSFCSKDIRLIFSEIQVSAQQELPEKCGTTIAGLIASDSRVIAFNAGDSRVYKISEKGLVYISHDHSLVQGLVDKAFIEKKSAPHHPLKNLIEFGIGPIFNDVWENNTLHIHEESLEKDAWYLLCSDGLNDLLTDQEIYEHLMPSPVENGPDFFEFLKKKKLKDNTSFIIVKIHP